MKKYLWIIPIVIACGVYSLTLDNFFVFDDFRWLYRAKNLGQNWGQIFVSEGAYFDPLIYLMFFADFQIAGLDPRWYHAVDVMIHAVNSLLVYSLAKFLTADEKASIYGSVFFASSFAIADAVLWPSSRVDLVSVMFSLLTVLQFLKYIQTENNRHLLASCLLFIVALGAKGTPVVVPLILMWLLYINNKPFRHYKSVIPFILFAIVYLILVFVSSHNAGIQGVSAHFNLWNLSLAVCDLYIPERYVAVLNPFVTSAIIVLLALVLGLLRCPSELTGRLRMTGFVIVAIALLPVLILNSFKLADAETNAIYLLSSPSHRIYLASVGSALFGGGVLRAFEILAARHVPKISTISTLLILLGIMAFNVREVRERNSIWQYANEATRCGLNALLSNRDKIVEDGIVGLVQFPGSGAFMTPMIKLYLGLNNVSVYTITNTDILEDQTLLDSAENASFFALWKYDNRFIVEEFSDNFKSLLLICRQANLNPSLPEYTKECAAKTLQFKQYIK